jgi:hypothetical protein
MSGECDVSTTTWTESGRPSHGGRYFHFHGEPPVTKSVAFDPDSILPLDQKLHVGIAR